MRSSDCFLVYLLVFFFKQKTAYEVRISDWSSDVCSSDLLYKQNLLSTSLGGFFVGTDGRLYEKTRDVEDPVNLTGLFGYLDTLSRWRSEERRVGKECVSTCRSRRSPNHSKKNTLPDTRL